jgi:branched-chain amino acid transport system ATP-binding protein
MTERPRKTSKRNSEPDARKALAEAKRSEADARRREAQREMAEAKQLEREAKELERAGPPHPGLVVDGIDVFYGSIQALRGVSLHIKPGEMVALLGANGAGKSTTLKTISGLVAPRRGSITFETEPIHGMPAYDVVSRGIAHMPEGRELFPSLIVEENLRFGYYSRLKDDRAGYEERLETVFDLFPRLRERRRQAAGTMSGGEQQMLTAARAMMSSPRLLIVDELSLGLAPMIVDDLFAALHAINKTGTSVLIVEQFIHLALANTTRAYVLAKGEVVLEGRSKQMADSPDLVEAYLGGTGDVGKSDPTSAGIARNRR